MIEKIPAKSLKRTKIVATLGPASSSKAVIEKLIRHGMNVARLNFSHGSHESHQHNFDTVREIAKRLKKPVAILQDLQGPKIRLGVLAEEEIVLKKGQELTLVHADSQEDERIPVQFDIFQNLKEGDRVLINDGLTRLAVLKVNPQKKEALCVVRVANPIRSKKGVNLPDTKLPSIALTPKDKKDLKFGLSLKVDYIALSFVQDVDDILSLKKIILKENYRPRIIAKIETREAVRNLEAIIKTTDAVMVARGDLAVEMDPEDVPLIQREIIHLARKHHKPVIVATQMMESMVKNPEPTRAEVNDVATAVLANVDGIMLSAESASGEYPVEAVSMMKRIIRRVERHFDDPKTQYAVEDLEESTDQTTGIAAAACILSHQLSSELIIVGTTSGKTAGRVSSYRPPSPILAITDNETTYNQLALVWGVKSFYNDRPLNNEDAFKLVAKEAKRRGYINSGDRVVFVAGQKPGIEGGTNSISVEKIA